MEFRQLEIKKRDPASMGINGLVSTLVVGGVLMMVGIYAYTKVGSSIDSSSFTTAENTTFEGIKTNVLSGFDLGSVAFIVIAAAIIISILLTAFR